MFNIFQKYHVVTNFPKDYPVYKKILANIVYFLTGIIYQPRKNLLSKADLLKARFKMRKGDIILLGNFRETSALIIGGTFTHTAMYLGHKRFIHAVADGVGIMSLYHIFTTYDTMLILRILRSTRHRRRIIRKAVRFVKQQIGKPYNFEFTKSKETFFCSGFINQAYREAGYKTGIASFGHFHTLAEKIEEHLSTAVKALKPEKFLQGNFRIIFLSHNLALKGKRVLFQNVQFDNLFTHSLLNDLILSLSVITT